MNLISYVNSLIMQFFYSIIADVSVTTAAFSERLKKAAVIAEMSAIIE